MVHKVEGTVALANKLVEAIVEDLKKLYGAYWNFQIDFVEGSDVTKGFTLKIIVTKK